jgi:hypothetical protein
MCLSMTGKLSEAENGSENDVVFKYLIINRKIKHTKTTRLQFIPVCLFFSSNPSAPVCTDYR